LEPAEWLNGVLIELVLGLTGTSNLAWFEPAQSW